MKTYQATTWMLSLWILLAMTTQAFAQTTEPDAPIIGWGFDEFHIGGEEIYNPRICRDYLNMDFTYHYGGYTSWDYMTDPRRYSTDPNVNRVMGLQSMIAQADSVGMKLIYAPDNLFSLQTDLRSYDWYYDTRSDTVDIKDFRDRIAANDSATVDSVGWVKDRYIAWVKVKASGSSTPDSLFIMGAPRFTQEVTQRGDSSYFVHVIKVPDSSTFFDLRVAMKVIVDSVFDGLANSDTLAYLDVIRRAVVSRDPSCDSCRCPFYFNIERFPVTKQMYLKQNQLSYDHKQFTFSINLLDTSRTKDTVYGEDHLGYPSPAYGDSLSRCDSLLVLWKQQGKIPQTTFRRTTTSGDYANVLEQGDLYFNIISTRLVPIQVLGGSISQHIYDYLDRPQRYPNSYRLDSMIYHHVDTLASDTMLWPMMAYISLWDEPIGIDYNAYRIITNKVQRRIRELHPSSSAQWRGVHTNTLGGFGTLRLKAGDFDSTAQRSVSMVMYHAYPMSSAAPAYYANKDSMDPATFQQYFNQYPYDTSDSKGNPTSKEGYGGATHFPSTVAAHRNYTQQLVGVTVFDRGYKDTSIGGLMTKLRGNRAIIDDAQFKFAHLGKPKVPVYNNVQQAGYLGITEVSLTGKWSFPGAQPRTPEVITAGAWLSLNCGNQGIMFSDLLTSGKHLGIFTSYGINPRLSDSAILATRLKDYDTLRLDQAGISNTKYTIPKMWLGYRQRFNAIRRITSAIKRLDTLYTELQYDPAWQISVERSQDPPKSRLQGYPFSGMPLVDTAYTIQAKRFVAPDSLGQYADSLSGAVPVADSIQHTYLEITHYKFKDPTRSATGERVLLLTNKRTWPTDTTHQTEATKYWDGNYGLGAIDVRLPVLRLKNTTGVVADSFVIERVGEPYAWRDTGAFGHDLRLQWLEPGWGAMYRVTPLSAGVSDYGTSFSNAVRSIKAHGRQFVVFERDSAIFLRTIAPDGVWLNAEWMISDADDTSNIAESGFQQAASNMYPAIAKPFDANSLMVVWERRNNEDGTSTIQVCRIDTLPTTATLPDTTRRTLAPPVTLTASWMRLMPSIVGLTDSGYVASWSRAPLQGINVVAVRDKKNFSVSNDVSQQQVAYAKATDPDVGFTVDTNAWHSTVAHVPKKGPRLYPGIAGGIKGGKAKDDVPWQYVHLAYQQGTPDQANSQFIFYNLVYARTVGTGKPLVQLALTEHVSKNLDACGFLHPCIAADSARIGVAFQLNTAKNRYVLLRFRDTIDVNGNVVATDTNGNQIAAWTTPAYKWGGEFWQMTTFPPTPPVTIKPAYFERPSLTEFPSSAKLSMDGGLTWVWTNMKEIPGMNQHTGVMLYRYGWKRPELMTFGHYPTMTLAPTATEDGFAQTSIFHRGDTMQRFWREHPYFDSVRHYPSFVINTPAEKNAFFTATPATRNIHSFVNLIKPEEYCNGWRFGGGIGHDWIDGTPEHPPTPPGGMPPGGIPTGGIPTPPTGYPGLPPVFFQPPGGVITTAAGTQITTLKEAEIINRTSVFTAATHPVSIRRVILRNSDLQAWLAAAPFDSARNAPANIYVYTELLRASDSAVLWRGDTVTARDIDTALQEEEVEVPVGIVATPGTGVFIRLRIEASEGLDYNVESGFHFGQRFDTATAMPKRLWYRQRSEAPEAEAALLTAEVLPNPTAPGKVELRLTAKEAGSVRLTIYTMLGQQVTTLPAMPIARAGAYAQPIDLSGLQPGIYLIVAQQGPHKASAKVTVVGR